MRINKRTSFSTRDIFLCILALLVSLACYLPLYEPYPWEADSSGFYFFRFEGREKEAYRAKLIKYVVDSKEEIVVKDLGFVQGAMIGSARFLPVSNSFVWLQLGQPGQSAKDIAKEENLDMYLVSFSLEKNEIEEHYPLKGVVYKSDKKEEGALGTVRFSPVQDKLYYLKKTDEGMVLSELDIESKTAVSRPVPLTKYVDFRISRDGASVYLPEGKEIARYDLKNWERSVFWREEEEISTFHIDEEYIRINEAVFKKKGEDYGRSPVWTLPGDDRNGEADLLPYQNAVNGAIVVHDREMISLVDPQSGISRPILWIPFESKIPCLGLSFSPNNEFFTFSLVFSDSWLIAIVETQSLSLRDIIIPWEKDPENSNWKQSAYFRAIVSHGMRAPGSLDTLKKVVTQGELWDNPPEPVIATLRREDLRHLKGLLPKEDIRAIKGRPSVRQALRAISGNDRDILGPFFESSVYHIDPDKTRVVFEKMISHPDISEQEAVELREQFRRLSALADLRKGQKVFKTNINKGVRRARKPKERGKWLRVRKPRTSLTLDEEK